MVALRVLQNHVSPPLRVRGFRWRRDMSVLRQDHVVGTGVLLWIVAAVFPLLGMEDTSRLGGLFSFHRIASFGATTYMALCVILFGKSLLRYVSKVGAKDRLMILYGVFGCCAVISGVINVSWVPVLYAIMFAFVLAFMLLFWTSAEQKRQLVFRVGFWILAFFLSFALVLHGLPENRWVGGIHPNHYGAVALASVIFARLSGSRIYFIAVPLGIAATMLVSSRFALAAIFIFVFVDWFFNGRQTAVKFVSFGALAVLGVLGFALDTHKILLGTGVSEHVFAVSSEARGIESGFTGRAELWKEFYPQFVERPFAGYGFRLRERYSDTHNAYLNLILEMGMVGASVLLLALAFIFFKLVMRVVSKMSLVQGWNIRRELGGAKPEAFLALLLALAFSGFFQPQWLSFSDVFGILVFLMLTSYVVSDRSICRLSGLIRGRYHERAE